MPPLLRSLRQDTVGSKTARVVDPSFPAFLVRRCNVLPAGQPRLHGRCELVAAPSCTRKIRPVSRLLPMLPIGRRRG